jgi:TPR repeat protein
MFEKLSSTLAALVRRDPESRLTAIDRALAGGWSESSFEALKALAAGGHHGAQYRLGRIYETADGVVQSLPDAVHWYRQAAEGGDVAAQVRLGLIFFIEPPPPASLTTVDEAWSDADDAASAGALAQFFPHGVMVRQDFAEAFKWNGLAAARGSAEAQARLGHQYALGLGVEADPAAAERWFAAAAEQSSAEGQLGLGLLYGGSYDTPPDLARAAHWLCLAAAQDHKIAQYGLGKLQLHGAGMPKDPAAAIRQLERSAAQDYPPAMYLLGMIHWQGSGVPVDAGRGETWLRRAGIRGHGEARCALALLLLERPEDDGVEAAALLQEQAEAGNARAAAALAECYAFGRGVPRDAGEAVRWREISAQGAGAERNPTMALEVLERAARSGDAGAQAALGFKLAAGVTGSPDPEAARPWLTQAAEGGDAGAQAWLGDCHRLGLSGVVDHAAAEAWYRRAASQGHIGSIVLLASAIDTIEQPSPEQQAEAFGLWLAAASAGDTFAQSRVARCYRDGRGCEPDLVMALEWMRRAEETTR